MTFPGFIQEFLKCHRLQIRELQTILGRHMENPPNGKLSKQRIVLRHLIRQKGSALGDRKHSSFALIEVIDTVVGHLELITCSED